MLDYTPKWGIFQHDNMIENTPILSLFIHKILLSGEGQMSKKFKGKACVYCATAGAAETGDHVLAREFVPVAHRAQIPKVPACRACNGKKAELEHYLATVIPFGGRHADASTNLKDNAPRRLAKNQKLHRTLARGSSRLWSKEASGLLVRSLTVPIDGEKLEQLVAFIVRGLIWHHWGIVLGADCFVEVLSLTSRGEAFFARYRKMRANNRVKGDIGDGALVYEGAQGTDNPQVSVWELTVYGGLKMVGTDDKELTSKFGALTGPSTVKDRAEDRIKRGAFILAP
jgi:hypothetical protein